MTPAEAAELGATIQSYTGRTWGEVDAHAWAAALHDLDLAECRRAVVAHYSTTDVWLMPAHVRRLARAARADRLARDVELPPDADPDDVPGYLAALRQGRHAIATGTEQPRPVQALVSGAFRKVPPARSDR